MLGFELSRNCLTQYFYDVILWYSSSYSSFFLTIASRVVSLWLTPSPLSRPLLWLMLTERLRPVVMWHDFTLENFPPTCWVSNFRGAVHSGQDLQLIKSSMNKL